MRLEDTAPTGSVAHWRQVTVDAPRRVPLSHVMRNPFCGDTSFLFQDSLFSRWLVPKDRKGGAWTLAQ